MTCPACKAQLDPAASACSNCGLLLIKLEVKSRRAEDQATQKRRETDKVGARRADDFAQQKRRTVDQQEASKCEYCDGTITGKAVRCKHCGEILNEQYYRDRAQRIRSRINYASWIAYIFGLGALLVFRPVGLISIAAGLLLSITYYAIPVEPPSTPKKKRASFLQMLKNQFRLERTSIAIPAFGSKKLVFVGTPLIAAIIGYSANLLLVQEPMNQVLKQNSAFNGMEVSAHYEYYMVPGVVVYDLKKVSIHQSPIDVHTAFLEFAKKMKAKRYSRVDLSYRGTKKFSVDGASFNKIGSEYAKRNFDYVLYTFPSLFRRSNAQQPAGTSDHDALVDFHRRWYGNDQLTKPIANGL